ALVAPAPLRAAVALASGAADNRPGLHSVPFTRAPVEGQDGVVMLPGLGTTAVTGGDRGCRDHLSLQASRWPSPMCRCRSPRWRSLVERRPCV
ncbi:MAG: hypothetical protein M3400_15815, partial [Actinomycetota bacterium]|nr:hypothetical protein [Actinomycetota bacterium]